MRIKAPKKLSEAIRMGLHDLALVQKSKIYKVKMSQWHRPDQKSGVCQVCFAGSVMAKTLKFDPTIDFGGLGSVEREWASVFSALNEARVGNLFSALNLMGQEPPLGALGFKVRRYEYNKKKWREDMWKVVRYLEKNDL